MMKTNGAFGNNEYATTSLGEIQEQPTNDSEEKRKVPSSKSKREISGNKIYFMGEDGDWVPTGTEGK